MRYGSEGERERYLKDSLADNSLTTPMTALNVKSWPGNGTELELVSRLFWLVLDSAIPAAYLAQWAYLHAFDWSLCSSFWPRGRVLFWWSKINRKKCQDGYLLRVGMEFELRVGNWFAVTFGSRVYCCLMKRRGEWSELCHFASARCGISPLSRLSVFQSSSVTGRRCEWRWPFLHRFGRRTFMTGDLTLWLWTWISVALTTLPLRPGECQVSGLGGFGLLLYRIFRLQWFFLTAGEFPALQPNLVWRVFERSFLLPKHPAVCIPCPVPSFIREQINCVSPTQRGSSLAFYWLRVSVWVIVHECSRAHPDTSP